MSVHWLLCFTNETWGGFCKGDRKFLPLPVQCFSYLKKYLKPGHSIYCYLADAKGFIGNLTVTSDVFVDKKPVEGYPDEYTSRINVEANLILDSANVILVEPLMESLILFKKGVLAGKEDPVGSFWKNFQTAANGSPSVIPSDDAEIILEKMLESKAAASINAGPASCAEETHADALPTTEHKPDRATSHYLTVGEVYSRAKLAEIFAIPNEGPIKTGVFRPDKTRFDSIWLFVTEEKTADMAQFKDLLSGGELYWQGQLEQGTDNLIIGHMNLGLEILVFYRKSKYQFPNSAFVFEGTFAYHSHELGSKPTNFILKRLPSALSMQAPHRDTTRFQILEELIANAHEIGTLFFLFFTVLHCKQVSGEGLHFVPTSLLFANIYKTILATGDFSQLRLPKSDTSITQRIAQILSSSSVGQSFGMAELEHELRREISETELSMALNTIAQFLNLQVQTGTREEIISLSKERFALGTCPLVISQTGSLLQLHPEWITYFENSADELLSLISEKLLSLISQASEDVDLVDNLLEQLSQARDAALKQGGYELSPAQENKNETSDHETLTLDVVYSTGDWQESSRNDMSSASLLSNDEITQACFNEQVSEIVSDTPLPVEAEKLWDHPDRMHQSTAQSDCEVHERTSFSAPTVSEDLGRFSAHPTFIHHTEEPIKEASYGAEQLEGVGKVLVQEAPIPEQALVEGSLFAEIEASEGKATIKQAFQRLEHRLTLIDGKRSLCEARLSSTDYDWLKSWLAELDFATADYLLCKQPTMQLQGTEYTNQEAIGALLFLALSEMNRREGQEGEVWPLLLKAIHMELQPIMLSRTFEGSASHYVRNAIRAAVKCLNLRNVLDANDHSQILVSTFLQFGFTRYAIRLLPTWLSRQNWTESVKYLLSDTSDNHSESFYCLWENFKLFFQRKITKEQMNHELCKSPWILPEWHEETLLILSNPEARFLLPVQGAKRSKTRVSNAPVYGKFEWDPPALPKFVLQFSFEQLGLKASSNYRVMVNSKSYRILRDSSQNWSLSSPIEVQADEQAVDVEISSDDGSVVFAESISMWEEEDVQLFDLQTGRLVADDVRLKTDKSYAILASADLSLRPQPAIRQPLPTVERKLYLLAAGWDRSQKVYLENFELWNAEGERDAEESSFNTSAIVPFIERKKLTTGEPIKIAFRGESETTRVESLRVSDISVPVHWTGTHTETVQAINVGAHAMRGELDLLVKVRHAGKLLPLRKKLSVELSGSAYWDGICWNTITPESTLTVRTCKSSEFFFNYKNVQSFEDFGLFEGNTLRHRLSKRKMKLSDICGLGAALELRKIFNAAADAPAYKIAGGIVDNGEIVSVSDISASEMRIELYNIIDLDEKHQLIVWPDDSEPIVLQVDDLRRSGDKTWDFVPCTASSNLAVALSYDGHWCGAQWAANSSQFLKNIQMRMEPSRVASWIRWIHWPMLAKDNIAAMRRFAHIYPAETLAAWLMGEGLDEPFVDEAITQLCQWHSVTREVFAYWSPDIASVGAFTSRFLDNNTSSAFGQDEIIDAASKLWIASPSLMARYLFVCYHALKGEINWRMLYEYLQSEILFLHPSDKKKDEKFHGALDDCAEYLGVHKNFLSNECEALVDALFESNYVSTVRTNNNNVLCSNFKGKQVLAYEIVNYLKDHI